MVILHTETLKKWGGQQNRVLSEAIGLKKRGHKVILVCHKASILAEKAKEKDITVYEVNMVKQAHLITIPRLVNIIKKEKVDIVSTHSSVDSWAGGIAAKLTGRCLVRFRHNLYQIGRDPLTRLIYSIPKKIIAISNTVKNVLTECGLRQEKITVIHSSVNTDIFKPDVKDIREELGIHREAIVIGNTSTFTQVKGQEFLLKAFNGIYRECPCFLLLAGRLSESLKMRYLSHVEDALREKVIFLGHRDDVPRILKTIDIFIYPSILEGLGTSLLEAMATERPVIVSDIPTFRDFIIDRENGIFFRAKDHADLAEKVISIFQKKHLQIELGIKARTTILNQFSIDSMLTLTENLYQDIISKR
jgi:glycosyltransferase involved in cell wall biosynthesis